MNVNDPRWFRSIGAEKLMEEEEKFFRSVGANTPAEIEKKKKEWHEGGKQIVKGLLEGCSNGKKYDDNLEEIKEATMLEATPNDIVVVNKKTGEKAILLSLTSTDEGQYFVAADRYGELVIGGIERIKVLLTDDQKKLLEG